MQQSTGNYIFSLAQLCISFLPSLLNFKSWTTLIRCLFERAELCTLEVFQGVEERLMSVVQNYIDKMGKESPKSLDTDLDLVTGVLTLISCKPTLCQKINNFCLLLDTTENLLKSRLPAEKRLVLLSEGAILTDICSLSSWSGTQTCYSLACIELKLVLEEISHKHEETQKTDISDACIEGVIGCCGTIENSIGEMVDENVQTSGEILQKLIDDIRMVMKSVMFYLQKTDLMEQKIFVPVLRLFMRWLSDDSSETQDIIETFESLKAFFAVEQYYSTCGSFLVSAVLFQMEDEKFRNYVKDDLGYFLIDIGIRGSTSNSTCAFIFAPIFNDLLSYDIFLSPSKILQSECSKLLSQVLCYEQSELSFCSLSYIQLSSYLILCFGKRNTVLSSVYKLWDINRWVSNSINYLLAPLMQDKVDKNWLELKDMWFSSVNAVCLLLEKSDETITYDQTNMEFLISRSSNYSEIGDEISGALEELLALIVA